MKRILSLLLVAGCSTYSCERPAKLPDGTVGLSPVAGWPAEGTGPTEELVPREQPQQQRGLKGGELDDNDRFDEYLRYRDQVASQVAGRVHEVDVSERLTVRVVDAAGQPAAGAKVS